VSKFPLACTFPAYLLNIQTSLCCPYGHMTVIPAMLGAMGLALSFMAVFLADFAAGCSSPQGEIAGVPLLDQVLLLLQQCFDFGYYPPDGHDNRTGNNYDPYDGLSYLSLHDDDSLLKFALTMGVITASVGLMTCILSTVHAPSCQKYPL